MAIKCFNSSCDECGKKLGVLGGYRHPVEGREKCLCSECFEKINESEEKYSKFISNSIHHEGGIGAVCFVLINIAPSYERNVLDGLSKLPEIIEVHPLLGWYDMIVKLEAKDSVKLGSFIVNKIRKIEGIEDTRTLTGSFSLGDI